MNDQQLLLQRVAVLEEQRRNDRDEIQHLKDSVDKFERYTTWGKAILFIFGGVGSAGLWIYEQFFSGK